MDKLIIMKIGLWCLESLILVLRFVGAYFLTALLCMSGISNEAKIIFAIFATGLYVVLAIKKEAAEIKKELAVKK